MQAPPAILRVPRNINEYGRQKTDMSDAETIAMLRRALNDATGEVQQLRNVARGFASVLEMLVIMNREGKLAKTVGDDDSLLIPELPEEKRRQLGGSVTVARTPGGYVLRWRERADTPAWEGVI